MTRKSIASYELHLSIFAVKLRYLMALHHESQNDLAEVLGLTRQTIGFYKIGRSEPTFDNLIKIADHYNVTIDYLLKNNEPMTRNADVNAIQKGTGLDPEAIEVIRKITANPGSKAALNYVLSDEELISGLCWYLNSFAITKDPRSKIFNAFQNKIAYFEDLTFAGLFKRIPVVAEEYKEKNSDNDDLIDSIQRELFKIPDDVE